jgi:hypothetical protein
MSAEPFDKLMTALVRSTPFDRLRAQWADDC